MRTVLKPFACACLGFLVLPHSRLWADPPVKPRDELNVLHILIVADTNSNVGTSVGIDADHVASVLTNGVKDPKHLDLKRLDGDNATPEKVLRYFSDLKGVIKSDEAAACFYAGHGATSEGQQNLALDAGALKRKDLLDAMKATNARLIICLTDCRGAQIKGGPVIGQDAPEDNPVIRNLFFQARGVVDITASTLDGSMGDDTNGGFFTRSLTNCLRKQPEELAGPGDNGFVNWKAFFDKVKQATAEVYDSVGPHFLPEKPAVERQVPFAWSLGDGGGSGWRFGARVFNNNGDGVRIGQVLDPSPAKAAGLKVGDVLLRIDDKPLASQDDFAAAIDGCNGRIKLVFRDARNPKQVVTVPDVALEPAAK